LTNLKRLFMIRGIRLVIIGKVQGVGFRYYIYRLASTLKLRGWVINRTDGSVEIRAQGEEANLKKLCEQVKSGYPALAQVEKMEISWRRGRKEFSNFSILED